APKIVSASRGPGSNTRSENRAGRKTHQVVETVGKIVRGDSCAFSRQPLFKTHAPGLARFRFKSRVSGKTNKTAVALIKTRLFDAFAVKSPEAGFSPKAAALEQSERRTDARNHARAENRIGFGAGAET